MAEIINKKAAPPEPFKVGEKPDIKVKAKRPVLLGHHDGADTPTRVEKDEVGFVTEAEFKRHAHILEKVSALVLFLGLLFATRAQAQSYSANVAMSSGPLYTNTINVATGVIAGGAMSTSSVTNATTNNAVVATPVGLTRYDQCVLQFTYVPLAGALTTNYLFVYPSADGVNVDTNHPLATIGPITTTAANTNGLVVTNLSSTVIGTIGYIGFGVGNACTNTITNALIQVFVKPQRSG